MKRWIAGWLLLSCTLGCGARVADDDAPSADSSPRALDAGGTIVLPDANLDTTVLDAPIPETMVPNTTPVDSARDTLADSALPDTSASEASVGLDGCPTCEILAPIAEHGELAIDATNVYFVTDVGDARWLARVPKSGGTVVRFVQISDYGSVSGIAVDATYVYWAHYPDYYSADAAIDRAPITGGARTTLVSGIDHTGMIGVLGATLYFDTAGDIRSVSKAGGPSAVVDTATGTYGAGSFIAAEHDALVWSRGGALHRASVGAPTAFEVVTDHTPGAPSAIAMNGGTVYWISAGAGDAYLMKMPVAGGSQVTIAHGPWKPRAIASDGTDVYMTDNNAVYGTFVRRVHIADGTVTTVATTDMSAGIQADATGAYWVGPHGLVHLPKAP